jgi:hypothetical protein
MGERLTIPWVGTSGAADDGDYAAVVLLGEEGSTDDADAVRFVGVEDSTEEGGGRFEFADGTSVDISTLGFNDMSRGFSAKA